MAHTATGGSTRLGRESEAKRLGVKLSDGQLVKKGNVIIRQRGTKFYAGKNTRLGKDDTIYAVKDGKIKFETKTRKRFNGHSRVVKVASVVV